MLSNCGQVYAFVGALVLLDPRRVDRVCALIDDGYNILPVGIDHHAEDAIRTAAGIVVHTAQKLGCHGCAVPEVGWL